VIFPALPTDHSTLRDIRIFLLTRRRRWWHDWKADQFDELAGALVAGHLIECSAYVTGGYFSGFKDLIKAGKHVNMGFPIAEVDYKGECILAKEKDTGGCVTVASVTSQLVYEIQGP